MSERARGIVPILSLGAGVQSTTLALMAECGEFAERPKAAIFADTQWEPAAVYSHLEWLRGQLSFPIRVVTAGNIREDIISRRKTSNGRFASVPWFTVSPDGKKGMSRRQCTSEYKLRPIARELRRIICAGPRDYIPAGTFQMWIGISTDEASRMKDARQRYIVNRWPLIERGMSRADCVRWLRDHGYHEPPKSACIGCPFHNSAAWAEMRRDRPDEFADAVAVDAALREGANNRGLRAVEFMHRARVPLAEAVTETPASEPDLFAALECEGMCGV